MNKNEKAVKEIKEFSKRHDVPIYEIEDLVACINSTVLKNIMKNIKNRMNAEIDKMEYELVDE